RKPEHASFKLHIMQQMRPMSKRNNLVSPRVISPLYCRARCTRASGRPALAFSSDNSNSFENHTVRGFHNQNGITFLSPFTDQFLMRFRHLLSENDLGQ